MSDRDEHDDPDGRDRSEQNGQRGRNDRNGQEQGVSTAEKVLTVISVALTLLLFGYVAWQATQPTNKTLPEVSVVGTETAANGSLVVHVRLVNPGDEGLISATVEANCTQPPPDVTLDYIPADGTARGVVVCPPGPSEPSVSVSSWVPT